MSARTRYPRTLHLPWSPGRTDDDRVHAEVASLFGGREVVVTEKLDGENTTIYADGFCHARSRDSAAHPSRDWVRALARRLAAEGLPADLRLCGENLHARHAIAYDRLPSWFLVFGAYAGDRCLSWDETLEWCALLGLCAVPVRYRGPWDEAAVRASWDGRSAYGDTGEGYVVRIADGFPAAAFGAHVAKYVRADHVRTDQHWMHAKLVPNGVVRGG